MWRLRRKKCRRYGGIFFAGPECSLRALRGLHRNHVVVLGWWVPLQMVAAHADLVAHEFIAELERVQPVARDSAVAQAYHRAAQYPLEFVLQLVERIEGFGVLHPLADIEDGSRKLACLLGRDPRDLGVDAGEDRTDDAQRRCTHIHHVAVAIP